MIYPQNRDYSPQIDFWYARDVYRVGKGFFLFWMTAGLVGLWIFGLLCLCLALSMSQTAPSLPGGITRNILVAITAVVLTVGSLVAVIDMPRFRYWLLASLGAGGGLGVVFFLWRVGV